MYGLPRNFPVTCDDGGALEWCESVARMRRGVDTGWAGRWRDLRERVGGLCLADGEPRAALKRNSTPPRTAVGLYTSALCMVLRGEVFS